MVVLSEQWRRLPMHLARSAEKCQRQRAVPGAGVDRMPDVLEESPGAQLRQLGLAVRLHHLGHRHTVCPTARRRSRRRSALRTSRRAARRSRRGQRVGRLRWTAWDRSPSHGVRWRGRDPPTARRSRRRPRPSSRHDRTRRSRCCGRGFAVRPWAPISVALQQRAVRGVLDDLLGGDVERRVDHGRLHQHPSPVRRRCSSASSSALNACIPALGSPTEYGSFGLRSG